MIDIPAFIRGFSDYSLQEWIVFSLLLNVAVCVTSIALCWVIRQSFRQRLLFAEPQPIVLGDIGLTILAVILNSGIAVLGWLMQKAGWIVTTDPSGWRTLGDLLLLLTCMDLGMYLSHRLAHHPALYAWIHATHHRHVSVNPMSLFVLNPFEVLGFGSLILLIMTALPLSGEAVVFYLSLNLLFGTLGHTGVEPFPQSWARHRILRLIGSSSFHAAHHQRLDANFGFYTQIWDRLFRTWTDKQIES
jgi:Delta7-sterol 5-desaturase